MRNNGKTGLLAGIVAALMVSSAAGAPAAQRFMQTGSTTSQPIGHYEFCQSHKSECSAQQSVANAPKVTDYGWSVVREINASVNRLIMPMTDDEIYGRQEVWAYPADAGDCEDFVLLKRKKLIEAGFSASDLLITVVRKPDGEGHAVLTLRSAQGDYVLDNLDEQVRLWTETPYRFLKRQSVNNAGRWVTIDNSADVVVGAVSN